MDMKKKIKKVLLILLVLFIVIILYAKFVNSIVGVYINWHIKLPYTTKILYYERTEASWNSDGIYYTIVQYNSSHDRKKLNDMKWKSGKNSELETEVNEVLVRLARLNSQSVNTIDFGKQYKYYTQSKRDSSTLYLIYIEEEKRLYILEDLL